MTELGPNDYLKERRATLKEMNDELLYRNLKWVR